MNSFLAYTLNKDFLFNVDLLNSVSKENIISKIYKSFGIKKNISINIKENFTDIRLFFFSKYKFFFQCC